MATIRAAIFDLDGTLVDSLDDIATALGAALAAHGIPAPELAAVRAMVGDGARVLVERAVAGRAEVAPVLATFRDAYRARPIGTTRPYPGVTAALDALAEAGLTFAIASNKPHDLTRHLAEALFAPWPFIVIYGARPELPLKPDPTIALCCADELGVAPARCAFIGDTAIDMACARAAGMRAIGVSWGFRPRAELEAATPHAVIDAPAALPSVILS